MEKVFRRINGLIRIAQKRQQSDNEIDKLIGRQVERNLKMVKKIVAEEIAAEKEVKPEETHLETS